jgi:DNA-binding response OmpR family regulator
VRILAIEKERGAASELQHRFASQRYDVVVANSADDAVRLMSGERFALVVIRVRPEDRNALEVLSAIRRRSLETRVLLLASAATMDDRIAALNAGADDYLVEPLAFAELMARIRALLRRGLTENLYLSAGDLSMDLFSRSVKRGNVAIDLTNREFELLRCLLRNKGQVVTRHALTLQVWRHERPDGRINNLVDVHIASLRRKVDIDRHPKLIHTVRSQGFLLDGR